MTKRSRGLVAAFALAGSLAVTSSAVAGQQGPPPLPTAANGATVERLADVSVSVLAPTAPDALAAAGGSFPLDRWL